MASVGIHVTVIDGDVSPEERTRILADFDNDGPHRSADGKFWCWVLILTPVGHTGLNVTRACIGILFVSPR